MTRRIYKDEDNNLVLSYTGIEDSDYENLTHYELIAFIEKLDFWDDIDIEVYESVLADVGLDYDDYDDPDVMWEDYLARVKLQIKEGEENEKRK